MGIKGRADFALGSRYMDGGQIKDWPLSRRIISMGATVLARPLVGVTDPMSGFFAVRKATWVDHADKLNPTGFKIALEFMVKCSIHRILEVPITFKDRVHGESKLKLHTQVLYVWQLLNLYWFEYPLLVLAVGCLGVATVAVLAISCHRRCSPSKDPYDVDPTNGAYGKVRDLSV